MKGTHGVQGAGYYQAARRQAAIAFYVGQQHNRLGANLYTDGVQFGAVFQPIILVSEEGGANMSEKKITPEDEKWREQLGDTAFNIARGGGTESAFSGRYWDTKTPGTYRCICCGQPLFSSETKYDSGTGWPSFYAPIAAEAVQTRDDVSFGMRRTEALCSGCDAHLGHVFPDGPEPTGARYCMNSASLQLEAAGEASATEPQD